MAGQGKLVWDEKINLITALWKFHQFNCSLNNIIFTGNIYRMTLSYDVTSGSEIAQCNKIDKPLVVYRFLGNIMTAIITLRT